MTVAWQEDQKRLTPDDVQAVAFPLSRLGRRGFDEEHVRAFLQEVEREIVTLLNEKGSLWNEVERLRRRIITGMKQGDKQGDGVLFGREDAHVHAVRILSNAQLTADRYVADAQAYSHRLTEEARTRRDEILVEAQQHADMVLEEASSRAREAALATLNAPVASVASVAPQMEADRRARSGRGRDEPIGIDVGQRHPGHEQRPPHPPDGTDSAAQIGPHLPGSVAQ